jgi:translation elongation factor EF-Ts
MPPCHQLNYTCLLQLLASRLPSGSSVADAAAEVAGQVRENIRVRRAFKMQTTTGEACLGSGSTQHCPQRIKKSLHVVGQQRLSNWFCHCLHHHTQAPFQPTSIRALSLAWAALCQLCCCSPRTVLPHCSR